MNDAMVISNQNAEAAFRHTEEIIRAHSKTFFFATGLLEPAVRRAIRALYAFCRATDDLVDADCASVEKVEAWRKEVLLPPAQQTRPLLLAWALTREQYAVDRRYEQELIDGVRMDITFQNYETWEELADYCYHVASTVGLLSIPIVGLAKGACFEEAAPFALRLGQALQLTNILRDVGEDARSGRVYLPVEDLHKFGLTPIDIHQQVYDERFKNLMRYEIKRARMMYAESLPGITLLSPAARPAVGAAALLYEAILDEIEKLDYQVHEHRAYTSGLRKLWMTPGIMAQVYRLPRPDIKKH